MYCSFSAGQGEEGDDEGVGVKVSLWERRRMWGEGEFVGEDEGVWVRVGALEGCRCRAVCGHVVSRWS